MAATGRCLRLFSRSNSCRYEGGASRAEFVTVFGVFFNDSLDDCECGDLGRSCGFDCALCEEEIGVCTEKGC